jgi:hypothetical protein
VEQLVVAVLLAMALAVAARVWGVDSRDGVETKRRWFPGVAPR